MALCNLYSRMKCCISQKECRKIGQLSEIKSLKFSKDFYFIVL